MTNEENPFFKQPVKEKSKVVDILQGLVIALFVIIVLYLFVFTPNQVSGPSMNTTFLDNQLVLVNRIPQWIGGNDLGTSLGVNYNRGDVVVFSLPQFNNGKDIIKRIIGVPGDTISICGEKLILNGQEMQENYLDPGIRTEAGSYATNCSQVIVEPGKYFLMGDNRPQSVDSRYVDVGQIERRNIKGKVILTYWPLPELKLIGNEAPEPI